mgnify:CR=1 FL=1
MLLKKETFEKRGYDIDKMRMGSNKLVIYVCDYCNQIFEKQYYKYNKGRKTIEKDCCSNKSCNQAKIAQVFEKKYGKGIRTALQVPQFYQKQQNTIQEKYGVMNVFSDPNIQKKIKQTNIEKYGVENPQQNKDVQDKTKATMKERYGVEHPYQSKELIKKAEDKTEERFGVRHFGELQRVDWSEIINVCEKKGYELSSLEEEYKNKRSLLNVMCRHHNEPFNTSFVAMRNNDHQCPRCQDVYSSRQEQEIFDYIIGLGMPKSDIVRRDRKTIGMEMDIFLPARNFAIEHHGLYYHTDEFKEKELHFKKFLFSKENNIKLFQIYGDEWQEKQDICKSMIQTRLGIVKDKINARDCYVLQVDTNSNKYLKNSVIDFVNNNHLQGNSSGTLNYFVLLDKKTNEIVSCISFRKTMSTKSRKDIRDPNIEIARFCCKKFHNVRGAFSKLLKSAKNWAKEQGYSEIFTYSDCRFSWGNIYEKSGFKYKGHTGIGFYYLVNGERYARFPKSFLEEGKNIKECAEENGIHKIYNAGHYRWELKI